MTTKLPSKLESFIETMLQGDEFARHGFNLLSKRPNPENYFDALSEVGCAYAVRGFDFDYTGFLWLGDLLWRGDRWVIDQAHVFESGLINQLRRAKAETMPYGRENTELRAAVARAYRILMSRHMRGIYLWFEDDETRRHVEACLG